MHSNGTLTIRIHTSILLRQSANTLCFRKEISCFLSISTVHLYVIQVLPFQRKFCRDSVDVWADTHFGQSFSCKGNSNSQSPWPPQGFKSSSLHFQSTLNYFCIERSITSKHSLYLFFVFFYICLITIVWQWYGWAVVYQRIVMLREYGLYCVL